MTGGPRESYAAQSSAVIAVDVLTVALPLPEPLVLGNMTVTRREYVGARVRAADGFTGWAYCLSREAPVAEILNRLVIPHVIGVSSETPPEAWKAMIRGSAIVGRVGLVRRAIGLIDIALWDIAAQRAGVPVWQLLGRGGDGVAAMLVAAYPTPSHTADEVIAEVVTQAREGWPLVKISRSSNSVMMRQILTGLNEQLPSTTGVVVDVGFGWHDSGEALAEIAQWGNPRLAWLEDPLLPEDIDGCRDLVRESGYAIGVGDEVTDPRILRDLVEDSGINVLRVDVVAIGGITPALEVIAMAEHNGVAISGHVYPEVTAHLGIGVETFNRSLDGNPYDPAPLLVSGGPRFENGTAYPPKAPGLGFHLAPKIFAFFEEE